MAKKQRQIEKLTAQLSQAQQQLGEFETVQPFFEDAKAIHLEISAILGQGGGSYSAAEIATRAIELVSRRKHDMVYNILADEYTVEHEKEIIAKLVADARQKEAQTGEIASKVRAEYAINPTAQAKLAKRAQKAIWQEEQGRLMDEMKEQQRAHIEQELTRQEAYNRYNLDFAHSANLNLAASELRELYVEHDLLVLGDGEASKPVIYKYHSSDGEGVWWQHHKGRIYDIDRRESLLRDTRRVFQLATENPNAQGLKSIAPNQLIARQPVYTIHTSSRTDDKYIYTQLNRELDRGLYPMHLASAQLFTPIAYAMHKKQQQN